MIAEHIHTTAFDIPSKTAAAISFLDAITHTLESLIFLSCLRHLNLPCLRRHALAPCRTVLVEIVNCLLLVFVAVGLHVVDQALAVDLLFDALLGHRAPLISLVMPTYGH